MVQKRNNPSKCQREALRNCATSENENQAIYTASVAGARAVDRGVSLSRRYHRGIRLVRTPDTAMTSEDETVITNVTLDSAVVAQGLITVVGSIDREIEQDAMTIIGHESELRIDIVVTAGLGVAAQGAMIHIDRESGVARGHTVTTGLEVALHDTVIATGLKTDVGIDMIKATEIAAILPLVGMSALVAMIDPIAIK